MNAQKNNYFEIINKMGLSLACLAWLTCLACVTSVNAEDLSKETMKKVAAQNADALVWIKYTTKGGGMGAMMGMGGRGGGNNTTTALGTVLTEDGLVVTEQSAMLQMMEIMMAQFGGGKGGKEPPTPEQIKVMFPNGKELEADFVAQDKDYGLLFVRIRKESLDREKMKVTAIRTAASPKWDVGDQLIALNRWSDKYGSTMRMRTVSVDSEITKPIKAYGGAGMMTDLTPLFDAKGAVVAFATSFRMGSDMSGMDMMAMGKSFEKLIIPVDNLKAIFDQAKAAKPQPKKSQGGADADPEDEEE